MENELYHYGVLGMRWGVRKDRSRLSGSSRRKKSWSDDARTAQSLKKKSKKQLSNAELRTLNERTRLEQEYSRLNPNAFKRGVKFVAASSGVMATTMNLVNNSDKMIKLGKTAGDKIVDAVGNMVLKDLAKHGL